MSTSKKSGSPSAPGRFIIPLDPTKMPKGWSNSNPPEGFSLGKNFPDGTRVDVRLSQDEEPGLIEVRGRFVSEEFENEAGSICIQAPWGVTVAIDESEVNDQLAATLTAVDEVVEVGKHRLGSRNILNPYITDVLAEAFEWADLWFERW